MKSRRKRITRVSRASLLILTTICICASGQQQKNADPVSPAAHSFYDARYHVRFQIPAGWNFTRRDGELSTFHLDARSAGRKARLRAVANIAFNPYPLATFSGALFYFSVEPHTTDIDCATEASPKMPVKDILINGIVFAQGHDEHGTICIDARDEVYTTSRNGVCYRFDLVINSFCGGEVSGVKDMTQAETENIRNRLESILNTVVIDAK